METIYFAGKRRIRFSCQVILRVVICINQPPTTPCLCHPDAQCRFLLEVKQMPQKVVSSEVLTTHKV